MKKRFLALFLAFVLVVGMLPAAALAADSDFTIENGVLTWYRGSGGDVVIPNGVTSIGRRAFATNGKVTSVTIPSGVTSIGESAFDNCHALVNISIPNTVTSIGNKAFVHCTSLSNVTIPDGVTEVGTQTFYGCTSLTSVSIPDSVASIGDHAFDNCRSLISITIPKSVTYIGEGVFWECWGLTDVDILGRITRISKSMFWDCRNLTSVIIPSGVTSIEDYAFNGCTNLKNITISNSVTSIGSNVFMNCSSLTDIVIPSRVSRIGDYAFTRCSLLSAVTVPGGIQFGWDVFGSCSALKDIYYGGTEAQWEEITKDTLVPVPWPLPTIHFNSAGPEEPDAPSVNSSITVTGGDREIEVGERGTIYANASNPSGREGRTWTWTSSDANIVSFSENSPVDHMEGVDPILNEGKKETVYCNINFYGRSPGTATLTCTLDDGTVSEPVQIVVIGKDPGTSGAYNIPPDIKAGDDAAKEQLQAYWNAWYDGYDQYIEALRSAVDKAKQSDQGEGSIEAQAQAMMDVDKKGNSRYLTFSPDVSGTVFPKSWELPAYCALCSMLSEATEHEIDLSKVKLDNVYTADSNVVKEIAKGVSSFRGSYSFGGVNIDINCGNYFSLNFGQMTCTGAINGKKHTFNVPICSSQTDAKRVVADYLTQLSQLEYKAIDNIYSAIAKDILGQPISKFTEQYLTRVMPKIEGKLAELKLGNVSKVLFTCYSYCDQYWNLYKNNNEVNISKLDETLKSLTIDDSTVKDAAAKKAVKIMKDTQSDLNVAIMEYMTTGTVTPPKKSFWDEIHDEILFWLKCPVSVSVYNGETQIGYVGDDDIWYTDDIFIEEQGGSKLIHSKYGDALSFVVTGTETGFVSCTIEERLGSRPTGRLNFFDIPVEAGTTIKATLPSTGLSSGTEALTLTSGGKTITADEYISADTSASMSIIASVSGEKGGVALGGGTYVKGDAAVLYALPDDGYTFLGWYTDSDMLVSSSDVYEFTVRNDARFIALFTETTTGIQDNSLPTVESIPATGTAVARTQTVKLDGRDVEFQCYAVKNAAGNETNYVKVRDLAMALNGTKAQFNVAWDGQIGITSGTAYKAVGGEGATPYSGDQPYRAVSDTPVRFNGSAVRLTSFSITYQGGGYTYYKLRDLGQLLGFNVKWDGTSVVIETGEPYTGK